MARTKTFDEAQAIDAAMRMFWEYGFEGTSMQNLEQCTALNRTSLYNAFGNKRALFERALGCYNERVLGELFALLESAPTVKQGISDLLHAVLENQFDKNNPGGCMMALSVLESAQHDEQTIETMQQTMHGLKRELQSRLSNAKKSGQKRKCRWTVVKYMIQLSAILIKSWHYQNCALSSNIWSIATIAVACGIIL